MATILDRHVESDHSDSQAPLDRWPTGSPRPDYQAHSFDPTQGRTIGSDPYEDPTQGRKIGSDPFDDPTRVR